MNWSHVNFGGRSHFKKEPSHGELAVGVDYKTVCAIEFLDGSKGCAVCDGLRYQVDSYNEFEADV